MPYDTDRARPVSQFAYDRLARQASTKPRIATAGEFSAGKSTLLNLLIGSDLLTMQVTATDAPPIRLCHGADPAQWIGPRGHRQPMPEGGIDALPEHCREVQLFYEADILRGADIIDLPGLADPNRSDAGAHSALLGAHMAIWCTPATQAWRQSERSLWAALPDRLHRTGLLVVTRADKLDSDHERERVLRRLRRETEGLFSHILMLSATRGIEALQTRDTALWATSGCGELIRQITARTSALRKARLALLERYKVAEIAADPEDQVPDPAPEFEDEGIDVAPAAESTAGVGILELLRQAREAHARKEAEATQAQREVAPAPTVAETEPPIPREVEIWRNIAAQQPDFPGKKEISTMIEHYLVAISR